MAKTQHGTAYLFGIPETPIAQSTILSIRYGEKRENVAVTPDQQGNRVSRRADDTTTTVEITCRITGTFAKPALDSKVTIAESEEASDNGDYFVTGTGRAKQAAGHTEFTLSLERWEYMSSTPTV